MSLEPCWYITENLPDNRKKDVLPKFQAFLLDKKLAQDYLKCVGSGGAKNGVHIFALDNSVSQNRLTA